MNPLLVMPIAEVAASVSGLLTPFLPYLIKFGEKAGAKSLEEIGKKIGDDGWESVKRLWAKLNPWLAQSDQAAEKMAELASKVEVAEAGGRLNEIEKAANVFEFEIECLLKSNLERAHEITQLIKYTQDKHNKGVVFNIRDQFAEKIYNIGSVEKFYA